MTSVSQLLLCDQLIATLSENNDGLIVVSVLASRVDNNNDLWTPLADLP